MVSGGQDFTLKKWQLPKTGEESCKDLKCIHTERVHEKDINCVVMSPNDKFVATGSHDRTAKVSPIKLCKKLFPEIHCIQKSSSFTLIVICCKYLLLLMTHNKTWIHVSSFC